MSPFYSCCAPTIFFFFNDTATTEIYTLSLHDALPIYLISVNERLDGLIIVARLGGRHQQPHPGAFGDLRSEEHTSELQSQSNLVCRLLLEKKKNTSSTLFGYITRVRLDTC